MILCKCFNVKQDTELKLALQNIEKMHLSQYFLQNILKAINIQVFWDEKYVMNRR